MTKGLLYKSTFILGLSFLVSRLLGLTRDHLLARMFGVGGEGFFNLDVYFAAFRLPDFIFALLIMGTVSAAFVPVLAGLKSGTATQLDEKANLFVCNVLNVVFVATSVAAGVVFIFAPALLRLFVPGFSEMDFELTVQVTRLMLISPLFFSLSAVLQSTQNAFDKFKYYALAPVLYNLGIILGIVFFAQEYGVYGVAFGVILGAALHFLIQIPGVRGLGFRYRLKISLRDKHLVEMIRLVIPRIVGMSVMQVNLIFDTLVGSLLAVGSITVLNYAVNLNSLPMGMVGVSFAIASFATLSNLAVKGNLSDFADQLRHTVSGILFFVIPSIVGLFVLRFSVVDLVLGNGAFTESDILITGNTLAFFLIGLVGQSLIPALAKSFYAFKNTIIPVGVSIVSVTLNIGLNFYLALVVGMGVYGIALATSIAALLNVTLLCIFLHVKFLKGMRFLPLKKMILIVFSSVVMGVGVCFVDSSLSSFGQSSTFNQILALSTSILIGASLYFMLTWTFRMSEIKSIVRLARRRR
ncbi:murein biosynthesis integral membrane protein MurJ [Candidatus Peregrinibacteria bacterium]|nr:murein biosynthesis integral membrane protein MurJ [Candidatus Peregrinibacteria bacterium]